MSVLGSVLLATLASFSSVGVAPEEASIEDREADATRTSWRVMILTDADPKTAPLPVSLRAQLVDLPVELIVEQVEAVPESLPAQRALASTVATDAGVDLVVWFQLDQSDRLYLFISEQGRERTLVRELPADGRSAAGRAASAALIVRGVVAALVEGGHLGVVPQFTEAVDEEAEPEPKAPVETPSEVEPSEPEPEPEEEPRFAPRFQIAAAYQAEGYSPQIPVSHAVVVGLDTWFGKNLRLDLRFRGTMPLRVSTDEIELDVQRYPIALGLRGAARLRGNVDLGGGVVGIVEPMVRRATPLQTGVTVDEPRQTWLRGAVGAVLHAGWTVHPRVRLFVDVGADVRLGPLDFSIEGGETLLTPFPVRPRGQVGLSVPLGPPEPVQRRSRERAGSPGD